MRNFKVVMTLAFCVVPFLGQEGRANGDATPVEAPRKAWTGSTPALEEGKVKKSPKLDEFIGKWTGKWDDIFYVQLTISPVPGDSKSLSVIYEWEERSGQKLWHRELTGKIVGDVLVATGAKRLIDISLQSDDENRAQAYGHFTNPRRANLTRQKADEGKAKE